MADIRKGLTRNGTSVKNKRNYYRILHVQPDAPTAVIRASYQALMQKLGNHPDLGGEHWNATVINEAYAVLTDTGKRSAYDRELFGEKAFDTLGKQHEAQRAGKSAGDASGWQPFRPKVID